MMIVTFERVNTVQVIVMIIMTAETAVMDETAVTVETSTAQTIVTVGTDVHACVCIMDTIHSQLY